MRGQARSCEALRHPKQPRHMVQLHQLLVLLVVVHQAGSYASAAQPASTDGKTCGGHLQACCLACGKDVAPADCDQRECSGGRTCHEFGIKNTKKPNNGLFTVCLPPLECGKAGGPCCYSSDPTSEADRCGAGMVCVSERVGYGDEAMYRALLSNPSAIKSTALMGTCRNMTRADCGKRFYPCGAAARRLGCPEEAVQCAGEGDFCASPSDAMLGAARCLPLPVRCGKRNNACCPANTDARYRELWNQDGRSPVPYCSDEGTLCIWQHKEYANYGLRILNEAAYSKNLVWDGYFQRGYGQSRCGPLPTACGDPGEPCCPSMLDQRLSGMVHNRRFPHQPCNYKAAGTLGIYCRGAWQGALLNASTPLGTCTLNTADCGRVGKQCCREDVPESGPVAICESGHPPGTHYCTDDNLCAKCPATPTTQLQKQNCIGPSGIIEGGPRTSSGFSGRG